jgi:hypothetical protein
MAHLSFVQEPINTTARSPVITNWNPVIGYMLYRSTSIASLFYYKLVLEVYTGTSAVAANLIAKIKQRRNGYSDDVSNNKARAFFDLRDIANSVLVDTVFDQNETGVPFNSIHTLGLNQTDSIYSLNGDRNTGETQIVSLYVVGYENFSSAANISPTDDDDHAVNDTLYYLQASLPLFTPRSTDGDYIQSDAFNVFNSNSVTDRFLSDLETSAGDYNLSGYLNYIQDTDYHTVAFLNDTTNFLSDIHNMEITYYDNSGAEIGSGKLGNTDANGGLPPDDGGLADNSRLLYFGCGAANLEAQAITSAAKPSNNSGWAYYTVQGLDDTAPTPVAKTALYYFIKQDGSCKGFKVRRLGWRNSLGSYDYFNFKMKSTQTINVERNNYSSMLGTFNKSKWRYNDTQRGKKTRQTTATLKEIIQTDWITEQDANLLEKLIMSTDVYIIENADTDYTQGVMVTDSSFVRKTSANDKLIKYTINIEYANPVNTNS